MVHELRGDPIGQLLRETTGDIDRGEFGAFGRFIGGEFTAFAMRDNGIGVPADQLVRIFEMFAQVDVSRGRPQSGLGIGLALVKNLVEMHGGTVSVQSAGLRQGSEFTVRLPIMADAPGAATASITGEVARPESLRILVVDDNQDSATSLATLLQLGGHETHTAFDGFEAVQAAGALQPDVILLDIGLPILDGYEAARRIRAQPWGRSIVLVALTGWGQDEDRQKSKDAGFNSHLVKPVEFAVLNELLASVGRFRG